MHEGSEKGHAFVQSNNKIHVTTPAQRRDDVIKMRNRVVKQPNHKRKRSVAGVFGYPETRKTSYVEN